MTALHICNRCGLKCSPNNRVTAEWRGESGFEHPACAARYAGTAVHYVDNPDPDAPREVHTHIRDDGITDLYDISTLRRLHPIPRNTIDIDLTTAKGLMDSYTTTREDAEAVCAIRQALGTLFEPLLFVQWEYGGMPGGVWLIDGVHRAIGLTFRGHRKLPCVILDERDVAPHRVRGRSDQIEEVVALASKGLTT